MIGIQTFITDRILRDHPIQPYLCTNKKVETQKGKVMRYRHTVTQWEIHKQNPDPLTLSSALQSTEIFSISYCFLASISHSLLCFKKGFCLQNELPRYFSQGMYVSLSDIATYTYERSLLQISHNSSHSQLRQYQQLDCIQLYIHFYGTVSTDYNKIPLIIIKIIFEYQKKGTSGFIMSKTIKTHKWVKSPEKFQHSQKKKKA